MLRKKPTSPEHFSATQAAKIADVPYQTLDYWARTGFIVPTMAAAQGRGTERRYTFEDLLALRVARELRKAGASMQALRRVVNVLRAERNPLAECRLLVVGSDVALMSSCDEVMSLLQKPGQFAFPAFVCDGPKVVKAIRLQIRKFAKAA